MWFRTICWNSGEAIFYAYIREQIFWWQRRKTLNRQTENGSVPESPPHLAARIDKRPIDFGKIERATRELSHRYDTVLVEGAGGLMVPLTEDFLTIDYIAEKQYPLIFVTSGKLGSINHTLLSFEAIKNRDIALDTVLYNLYPTVEDKTIQEDTMKYIKQYLSKHFPGTKFEVVPEIV